MMKSFSRWCLPLAWSLCLVMPLAAEDQDQVNHLELASLMLRDGNLERAEASLAQVDLDAEQTDVQRFWVLSGLLRTRQGQPEAALEAFLNARDLGELEAVVHVHLAQTAYALERHALAIESLDRAGPSIARIPSVYHMRAQSHWHLSQHAQAIATLDQASRLFPDDRSFMRRKLFLMIELGFYTEAAVLGRRYLDTASASVEDHVLIGNALRASGQADLALSFLQQARLRFGADENVSKTLALTYINLEQYHSAASIIHQAALLNPALLSEAAELYRRAGLPYTALMLNTRVSDQGDKLKQRLALLLEAGEFDQAASMQASLQRNRLDADDDIRYALAYALFKTGQFEHSERQLSGITDSELFNKALELRRAMDDCQSDRWRCQ